MKVEKSTRYDIYKKKLTIFANKMLQAYEKINILKGFCTVKPFNNQKTEFFQIAKRLNLPKEFFFEQDNVDNSIIAGDFAEAIVTGERDFVLTSTIESKKVPRSESENFDYEEIAKTLSKIDNPTDIFIPIKPYFNTFYSWVYGNKERIRFGDKDPLLLVGNKVIQVHWITSKSDIKDIVVIDRNKIELIQKMYEQSDVPKEITPIPNFNHYSKGKALMLYFADKDEKNFDFVFRTVMSKPEIMEGASIIIDVKNKPEDGK